MEYKCEEKESEPSQQVAAFTQGQFDQTTVPVIKSFLHRFPPQSCEFSLANLICWAGIYDTGWFVYKDRLVVYDGRYNVMLMPVGPAMSPDELYTLSHDMICMGLSPTICMVPKAYIDAHPDLSRYYDVIEDRDAAEYIYSIQNLVNLNSAKLHKKKNLVSQFHRKFPGFKIEALTNQARPKALAWAKERLEAMNPAPKSLEEEFVAIKKAFDHWDSLGLEGLMLSVDGQMAAFSVFSRLNPDTFNVHFEKADTAFKGAAQVINQETAKYLEKRALFINREQDLGIPGLRQAKMSYEPHRLMIPYMLKLKPNA